MVAQLLLELFECRALTSGKRPFELLVLLVIELSRISGDIQGVRIIDSHDAILAD